MLQQCDGRSDRQTDMDVSIRCSSLTLNPKEHLTNKTFTQPERRSMVACGHCFLLFNPCCIVIDTYLSQYLSFQYSFISHLLLSDSATTKKFILCLMTLLHGKDECYWICSEEGRGQAEERAGAHTLTHAHAHARTYAHLNTHTHTHTSISFAVLVRPICYVLVSYLVCLSVSAQERILRTKVNGANACMQRTTFSP
jgi:hypothetical protein